MVRSGSNQFSLFWSKVVAKCWQDESFAQSLITNPRETLTKYAIDELEAEIDIPTTLNIKIIRDTDPNMMSLVIPYPPQHIEELDEEMLETIAGGAEEIKPDMELFTPNRFISVRFR